MRLALVLALALVAAGCEQRQERVSAVATQSPPTPRLPSNASAPGAGPNPAQQVPVIAGRFAPRDECKRIPGWTAFDAKLRKAVLARNIDALAALADPQIKLDFGGGYGRDELRARLNGPEGKALWSELDVILTLGCAGRDGGQTFSLPWFFAQNLEGEDPFEVLLAMGDAVPLRSEPKAGAPELARVSWHLVKPVGDFRPDEPFQLVSLPGRTERGHIETNALRSPIAHRLVIDRGQGGLRITAFLAGD